MFDLTDEKKHIQRSEEEVDQAEQDNGELYFTRRDL